MYRLYLAVAGAATGSVCAKVTALNIEAVFSARDIPYNASPTGLNPYHGENSKYYAWDLLTGVGLNFSKPPNAPITTPARLPRFGWSTSRVWTLA